MAQGYAFGRPAPLPSPTEVLIGELTDAPAEEVAGELLPEPIAPPAVPQSRAHWMNRPHEPRPSDETGELAVTGNLFDELADSDDD